jgi:4-hydroxybenzoate polyprenyltransferase
MRKVLKMVADASPLRTTHFILIYILGFVIATKNIQAFINLDFLFGILVTTFGWFFIVSINNYFDREHDKKSNPHRGLPQEAYSERELLIFTFSNLIIGFIFSFLLTLQAVLFYSLFVLLGYLYSCPRVYLKKYGIKSVIIGLGSGMVFGMGFFTLPGDFTEYFWFLFLLVTIIFSAGSVINDLKDDAL